jgi:predicted nucleic acid-binding protein
MGLIVDTNALSAIVDEQPGIHAALGRAVSVLIPVIVLGEYGFGIAQSTRRAHHQKWLRESLPAYGILDITRETAEHYAALRLELKRAGKPIPSNDLWIAALCREHKLPVLSRDRHFDRVRGLRRLEW